MESRDCGIDPITRMPGKESFLSFFQQFLSAGKAKGYVLLYFNIRSFRYYNILYGRKAGDEVLRYLAGLIRKTNPGDLSGRFGGDNFVTVTDRQDIAGMVQSVCFDFNTQYAASTMMLKAGVLRLDERNDAANCCELAKLACDAIRDTADNYRFYDQDLSRASRKVAYILQNMNRALHEGWIHVYYQPVIRTVNNTLCSTEALVRWIDPEHGMLSPGEFIPILEEHQQITRLDLHVLEEVCQTLRTRLDQGQFTVPVSINLSRLDFTSCDIFQEVEDCVKKYHLDRQLLKIEITESIVMRDPQLLKQKMAAFRRAGYEIWMDDFGSGYSSLNVLQTFEFDEIKLDMMFLHHFDEKAKRIIRSIISMAKQMRLETLAEGVETEEQYAFLRDSGCEKVQGYYFSPPVPPEKLDAMYRNKPEEIEPAGFSQYYSSVGRVSFITDQPMSILDYDGKKIHLLYANRKHAEVWNQLGINRDNWQDELFNSCDSYLSLEVRRAFEKLEPDGEAVPMEFNIYGSFISLRARMLAKQQGHALISIDGLNLYRREMSDKENRDYIFHVLFALYDEVYLIHLNDCHFEVIKAGANQASISREWRRQSWQLNPAYAAELYIQKEDRAAYVDFMNPQMLKEKMKNGDLNSITRMFRTLTADGTYAWCLHTIQLVPGTDLAVYSSQDVSELKEQFFPDGKER